MEATNTAHGDHSQGQNLDNETLLNVAALLREQVGSTRSYHFHLDAFPLDEETTAAPVEGTVKLTRLRDSVMANVRVHGDVELTCARCLRQYEQPFTAKFAEEYHQTVDLRTGTAIDQEEPLAAEDSTIDESHQLDLGDVLRQEILVALPMRPTCGPDCPGPDVTEVGESEPVDTRLATLSQLLDQEKDAT